MQLSSNSYYIPGTNIREFIRKTSIPITSIGLDSESYKSIRESKVVSTSNSENLTLSECTWFYIIIHSILAGVSTDALTNLKSILFAKFLGELKEGEENIPITSPKWLKAPILLDEIIYYVLSKQQDILINLYSSGAIEFVCTANDELVEKHEKEQLIKTFSIYQVLSANPTLKNLPKLKSTTAVLTKEEAELLNFIRSSDWTNCKVSKDRTMWQLEASTNKNISKAEANSLITTLDDHIEIKIKPLNQRAKVNCTITKKKKITL